MSLRPHVIALAILCSAAQCASVSGQDEASPAKAIEWYVVPNDASPSGDMSGRDWDNAIVGLNRALDMVRTARKANMDGPVYELRLRVGDYHPRIGSQLYGFSIPNGVVLKGAHEYTLENGSVDPPRFTSLSGRPITDEGKVQKFGSSFPTVVHVGPESECWIENIRIVEGRAYTQAANAEPPRKNGGGVFIEKGGRARLSNVEITGCHADASGGGVYNAGRLLLENCTIAGNTCDGTAGGVFTAKEAATWFLRTIVADNRSGDACPEESPWQCGQDLNSDTEGTHLWAHRSLFATRPHNWKTKEEGNLWPDDIGSAIEPGFLRPTKWSDAGVPTVGDLRLNRLSHAINRGEDVEERGRSGKALPDEVGGPPALFVSTVHDWDPKSAHESDATIDAERFHQLPLTDLSGRPRLQGGRLDIGAYEYPLDEPRGRILSVSQSREGAFGARWIHVGGLPEAIDADDLAGVLVKARAANGSANESDHIEQIRMAEGVYSVAKPLELLPFVRVAGGFEPELDRIERTGGETVLEVAGEHRVGYASSRLGVELDRLVIRNGHATAEVPAPAEAPSHAPVEEAIPNPRPGHGGGLLFEQAGGGFTGEAELIQVAVTECASADTGGAIWSNNDGLTLRHCTIARNKAGGGKTAGLFVVPEEPVVLCHTVLAANTTEEKPEGANSIDVESNFSGTIENTSAWNLIAGRTGETFRTFERMEDPQTMGLVHGKQGNVMATPELLRHRMQMSRAPGDVARRNYDRAEKWFARFPAAAEEPPQRTSAVGPTRIAPFVNLGNPDIESAPQRDLAGRKRTQGDRIDIGAYEYPFDEVPRPEKLLLSDNEREVEDAHLLKVTGTEGDLLEYAMVRVWDRNSDEDLTNDVIAVQLDAGTTHVLDVHTTHLAPFVAVESSRAGELVTLTPRRSNAPQNTLYLAHALNVPGVVLQDLHFDGTAAPKHPPAEPPGEETGEEPAAAPMNVPDKWAALRLESTAGWPTFVTLRRCRVENWTERSIDAIAPEGQRERSWIFAGDCEFENNRTTGDRGAAIAAGNTDLFLVSCYLGRNEVATAANNGFGGAVGLWGTGRLYVQECTFYENRVNAAGENAQGHGGAIWAEPKGTSVTVFSTTVAYNSAKPPSTGGMSIDLRKGGTQLVATSILIGNGSEDLRIEGGPSNGPNANAQFLGNVVGHASDAALATPRHPVGRNDRPPALAPPDRFGHLPSRVRTMPPLWQFRSRWTAEIPNLDTATIENAKLPPVVEFAALRLLQGAKVREFPGAAEPTGVIPFVTGVVHANNEPSAGQVVTLVIAKVEKDTTVTDSRGRFVFRQVPDKGDLQVVDASGKEVGFSTGQERTVVPIRIGLSEVLDPLANRPVDPP